MMMRDVVTWLGRRAGVNVGWAMQDWPLLPFVVDPSRSYWGAMLDLVSPWAPYIYYRPENNAVVFADQAAAQSVTGRIITLSSQAVKEIRDMPSRRRNVRRVILRTQ